MIFTVVLRTYTHTIKTNLNLQFHLPNIFTYIRVRRRNDYFTSLMALSNKSVIM